MKKILTLFAALTLMASAAMAESAGGFSWAGTGASYSSYYKALILENANLTYLKVGSGANDKETYGLNYQIIVKGSNNLISPTSKMDGIAIGGNSFDQYDDVKLTIVGEGAGASLKVVSQLHSAIYFLNYGDLCPEDVALELEGRLQDAQYAISAVNGREFDLLPSTGVKLVLNGKSGQFKNIRRFDVKGTSYAITDPAGVTMNTAVGNIFFILDGDNYYGKTTIMTGSGVKIGGVELDYTNWDNFTQHVSAGKVSYSGGKLLLENAQIDADMTISSGITIEIEDKCIINGSINFTKGVKFNTISALDPDTLIINGDVMAIGGKFTINNAHIYVYAPNYAFAPSISDSSIKISIGGNFDGSLFLENAWVGASDITTLSGYTIDEYTSGGKNYLHARVVEYYGISIEKDNVETQINNENCQNLANVGVHYDSKSYNLILENANLDGIKNISSSKTITLKGLNSIIHYGSEGAAIYSTRSLTFTGEGKLDIFTQNGVPAILMGDDEANVKIRDTEVTIDASGYAFVGNSEKSLTIEVKSSNMTIWSGMEGALHNVKDFNLWGSEFVSPEDVEFYNGQLCVNNQPLAASTEVIIQGDKQGIEDVVLTEKAQKVLVDGQVYIIRDNKLFDLTGAQVR